MIVVLLDIILYGFGWLINLLYRLKKGKGMDFFKTYYERIGSTNAYALARFHRQADAPAEKCKIYYRTGNHGKRAWC